MTTSGMHRHPFEGRHLVITVYHRQQNKWYPQIILTVVNLLAHNNTNQIYYHSQNSLEIAAVNCRFSGSLALLGVPFTLLAMVHHRYLHEII